MFENLKERYRTLTGKNSRKSVSLIFQNPGYVQDSAERHTQILIYKLMMIAAYADGSVDADELNLIKDYAFEQCLNEQEWAEISFFGQVKPSRDELIEIYRNILNEVKSSRQRKNILDAVRSVINADELISDEERIFLEILEKETGSFRIPPVSGIIKKLKDGYLEKTGGRQSDSSSIQYSMNPVLPLLKNIVISSKAGNDEVIAAKLGLAIVLINADMDFHEKEKDAFIVLIEKLCGINREKAEDLAVRILEIPDGNFEISHLTRILAESLSVEGRKDFLAELFKIARADQVYDVYEDKYLRIINNSLLLSHNDFISVKLRK
ncbi:MAG: TerB family tellurite resistance protein [Spirochaetes bacterium]|nr:TerB family tellurite resistance protein [Spirochaetota bacterium]